MSKITLTLAALSIAFVAVPAIAEAQSTPTPNFQTIDANHDGQVSYSELQVVLPNVTQQEFNDADADKSGGLDQQELTTITAAGTGSLTQQAPETNNSEPNASGNGSMNNGQ